MRTNTLFNDVDVAELYARHRGYVDEDFMDELADALGPVGGLVCDIGAGTGSPADALRFRGLRVLAVEPSWAMVAEGRRTHPSVQFTLGAGEALPLADDSCDAAALLYVLHHVDDPEAVLREAGRVVRPRGRIVVVSGNEECPRQRFFAGYFPTLVPDLPGSDEISLYARAAGLTVLDARTTVHRVYPHAAIDDEYVRMVQTDMFAALRELNEGEFHRGIDRLRRDLGKPIPAPTVTMVVLQRP